MRQYHRGNRRNSTGILYAVLLALVNLLGVLTKQRCPRLLMQEYMTSLAEQHKPALVQVLVVGLVFVVDIEELRPLVLLAAELAGAVPAGEYILAEHLPSRGGSEVLVLFLQCIVVVLSFHILNSSNLRSGFAT